MKTKTTHAQCAALIRKELKAAGIKASVTSESFSMGNAVNVALNNVAPEIREIADKICNKYQYGHFDGMTDCYEYSNKNDNIPQVKFVCVRNDTYHFSA